MTCMWNRWISHNYTRGLLTKLVTNGSTGGSGAAANKKVYTFEYDGFGALTKVYENGEEVRRYAYSAGSDYTGGESTYNYAAAGQVVAGGADGRIEWEKTVYTRDGAVLCVKSYATDGNGNLSGTESEIVRAVYDGSGRLTTLQDKRAGQTYGYAYDAAGRATGVTLTGRITGGTEEETDAEGSGQTVSAADVAACEHGFCRGGEKDRVQNRIPYAKEQSEDPACDQCDGK